MMVMTAKFNFKKTLMVLSAAAAVILSFILLSGGNSQAPAAGPSMADNGNRVKFLQDMGWDVKETPVEAGKVKLPRKNTAVYERYNNLQKSQGYDLSPYGGKSVLRFVYEVKSTAGSPILATLLVYKDQVIGGDVTDTAAGGKIRGLRKQEKAPESTPKPAKETLPQVTLPGELPH